MTNFAEMKNDTARKSAARAELISVMLPALVATYGEDNVARIDFPVTVQNADGKEIAEIGGNSIAVCVGQTPDKDGATVDMVAIIDCTIKAFNTVTNKKGNTTYAVNFDDVLSSIEATRTERETKAAEKAAAKAAK